jgi:hypothetical protein
MVFRSYSKQESKDLESPKNFINQGHILSKRILEEGVPRFRSKKSSMGTIRTETWKCVWRRMSRVWLSSRFLELSMGRCAAAHRQNDPYTLLNRKAGINDVFVPAAAVLFTVGGFRN